MLSDHLGITDMDIVIAGAGAAAVSAAAAARETDRSAGITIISPDGMQPYKRPALSKAMLLRASASSYRLRDPEWYTDNAIGFIYGRSVEDINPAGHIVVLDSGEILRYRKLIYAAGSRCVIPPVEMDDPGSIITLHNYEDIMELKRRCADASHAVIAGGGFIGLEAAWILYQMGIRVDMVEGSGRLMGRAADKQASEAIKKYLQDKGIGVHTGHMLRAVRSDGHGVMVEMKDGSCFSGEIVVFATGVRANKEPVEEAGIACGKAVITDEMMKTSDPDIYACGDVCEFEGMVSSTWEQAVRQGRVAGVNAAGGCMPYEPVPSSIMTNLGGFRLFSVGMISETDPFEQVIAEMSYKDTAFLVNGSARAKSASVSLTFLNGKLQGVCATGDLREICMWQQHTAKHTDKKTVLEELQKRGVIINGA